jgi:hypothetical protein
MGWRQRLCRQRYYRRERGHHTPKTGNYLPLSSTLKQSKNEVNGKNAHARTKGRNVIHAETQSEIQKKMRRY